MKGIGRALGISAIAVLASTTAACKLDPKSACRGNADCLAPRACVQGVCVDPTLHASSSGASVADASPTACDPLAMPCAPAQDGQPMTCYRASALAGTDFCAPACDPAAAVQDPVHSVCDPSGALLQRCHPNEYASQRADCPQGLSCYRTSVLADSGICLQMRVCSTDADCPRDDHKTCAATLLRELVPDASSAFAASLHLDHLNCLHAYCQSQLSACTSGEDCLGANFRGTFDDLCVPRCNANVCPPNYSCEVVYKNDQGEPLCVPSVPGARCGATSSCVAGTCDDTGAGFSVCSAPCEVGCPLLNTSTDAFVCVDGGGVEHCVTARSFSGANCESSQECNPDAGEFCATVDVNGPIAGHGECRVPCKPDGTCDPRGGLPHGCLFDGGGGCFPAVLGVACTPATGCIAPLSCEEIPPEPDVPPMGARVCSKPCAVDGGTDADGDVLCGGPAVGGYCAGGWCRAPRRGGLPCDAGSQCRSASCDPSTRTCLSMAP